ncbi:MAG: hypothetical protein EKK42_29140 [Pseudonocardiaceae bacterium]|nr:MAG: hypothetical protein EKK42_29140 [Pseudonocardiaceae bacterium]
MSDEEKKRFDRLIETGLSLAKNREGARHALAFLFPKAEKSIHTYLPPDADVNIRRIKRRVSIAEFSENYFSLSPQLNDWSKPEFEQKFGEGPTETFELLAQKIAFAPEEERPDLRRTFIELLDAEFSSRAEINQEWLDAIINASQTLIRNKDEEAKFLFHFDNLDRLRWLLQHALERLPKETRATLIKSAIAGARDLSLLVDLVRGVIGDLKKEGAKREGPHRVDLGDESEAVRSILLSRVRTLATSGEIWHQARPAQLLWFWWGSTEDDEVLQFTSTAMDTREGLIGLLSNAPSLVRSSEEDYEHVSPTWRKIVDLDQLNAKAEELLSSTDRSDAATAERFIAALRVGRNDSF